VTNNQPVCHLGLNRVLSFVPRSRSVFVRIERKEIELLAAAFLLGSMELKLQWWSNYFHAILRNILAPSSGCGLKVGSPTALKKTFS
jgi:hypothetical protein